jgi:hypothetical protein
MAVTPGFLTTLNGVDVVTVSSNGLNVLNLRVYGDRVSPEFASLEINGGQYGEDAENKHLIWESDQHFVPGDEIAVTFLENAFTSRAGRTIEKLFPDEQEPQGPRQPIEQIFQRIAQRPKVRDGFSFLLSAPAASPMNFETSPEDHNFGFSISWEWTRPELLRASLSSNSLGGIAKREGGTDYASFRLRFGEQVILRVNE